MSFWAVVQCVILLIGQGQVSLVLWLAVLAGIGVSTAHVLPDAIFPDVIEWDELRTRRRHEGMYYGAKNFIRKITGALAIFLALQALGWSGYRPPPAGATSFAQAASALQAIRIWDWAGRGAAAGRRGAGGLALPAHARAAPARAAAAGAAAPARGSGSLDRRAHSREPSVARHTWPRAGRIWYNSADSIPALHPWIGRTT
ncbi:MAG: MFS transporter [Kouleothrix sp.]|nr:MFS transporter [Kouleothrix sp.]